MVIVLFLPATTGCQMSRKQDKKNSDRIVVYYNLGKGGNVELPL
jgi:hypothetical protein